MAACPGPTAELEGPQGERREKKSPEKGRRIVQERRKHPWTTQGRSGTVKALGRGFDKVREQTQRLVGQWRRQTQPWEVKSDHFHGGSRSFPLLAVDSGGCHTLKAVHWLSPSYAESGPPYTCIKSR